MGHMTINEIWEHYKTDLEQAEAKINEALKTVAPAISMVGDHLLSSGGKRIRPFLAILSSIGIRSPVGIEKSMLLKGAAT